MKTSVLLVTLSVLALGSCCLAQDDKPLQVYPQSKKAGPAASEKQRAKGLFMLAQKENPPLQWDRCLSNQAFMRAKRMGAKRYFEHEDPETGENFAWKLVKICIPKCKKNCKVPAGENLSKGADTPENIHKALMESPTHRKNIVSRKFNRMGVGCSEKICVELFAGF